MRANGTALAKTLGALKATLPLVVLLVVVLGLTRRGGWCGCGRGGGWGWGWGATCGRKERLSKLKVAQPRRAPILPLQPKTGWQSAAATWYISYPPCCSDPRADQKECAENNGCAYQGVFAGTSKRMSKRWVERNNIAAVFQVPDHKNQLEWDFKWKGKKIEIKNEYGRKMIVNVLDTCKDSDCKGCCTQNANTGGGTLVDLEINTATRFWGPGAIPGLKTIQWRLVK